MNFDLAPGGYRYRALKLAKPQLSGWDVVSLQTALGVSPDGYLGPHTDKAIRRAQKKYGLTVDGIAGVLTQRQLASAIIERQNPELFPRLYGQVEHESSFWLGNFTPPYPDGSRDCGATQRNTRYTPMLQGFDTPASIRALDEKVRDYHRKYQGWGVKDPQAWDIAQGSWNSPLFADRLAKGDPVPETFKQYVAAVSTYAMP